MCGRYARGDAAYASDRGGRLVEPHESPSLSADVRTDLSNSGMVHAVVIRRRPAWPQTNATDRTQREHMMLNAIQRSPQGMRALHITVSCLAFAAYSVSGIVSAHAQCAASGALGSAGDASASQALEVVRDRRMQVAQSCPAGSTPGPDGMCTPVAGSAAVTSASTPNAQPPGQPKAKKAPGVVAAPAPGGGPYGGRRTGSLRRSDLSTACGRRAMATTSVAPT